MDDNAFAALIASVIIAERRLGNYLSSQNLLMMGLEDVVSKNLGCVVSGYLIEDAVITNRELPHVLLLFGLDMDFGWGVATKLDGIGDQVLE